MKTYFADSRIISHLHLVLGRDFYVRSQSNEIGNITTETIQITRCACSSFAVLIACCAFAGQSLHSLQAVTVSNELMNAMAK